MGSSLIQASFTGGELSPSLYGRVDQSRYATSARTVRNFISQIYGGVTNRPGFIFTYETKTSSQKSRLIPFQFSTLQNYVIEVGHEYMRFYKDGGVILSGGIPVEIATPYDVLDIFDLKFTQSADVMTITHPDYAPRQLTRSSHTAWTLTTYARKNGPFQDVNSTSTKLITASATTGSVTLTASGSGFTPFTAAMVGTLIYIEDAHLEDVKPWASGQANVGVGVYRRSDGKVYISTTVPTTLGTKGYRTAGDTPTHDEGKAWDGDMSIESTGQYAEGVEWQYVHSGFGIAQVTAYTDSTHITVTVLSTFPASVASSGSYKWAFDAWGGDQGYPSCVTYHQERQVFAATSAQPQAYWLTKTGSYIDFGTSVPTEDTDAISKTVPGRQVNAIRHLLPIDDLMLMTSGAEFKLMVNQDGAITPSAATAKPQTYNGCSQLPPLIIVDTALYVQEKGNVVRDLAYTYEKDKYTGGDLTAFSSHLFQGKTLVDWAFAQVPYSVVWAVRDDGVLLGLTYMKEQQVIGWHRHDTEGLFESVCVISEEGRDVLYAIVKRTINGTTKRYVERMANRVFTDIRDSFFVDSGLSYDGRDQAGTLTLSGGSVWDNTEQITATLSGSSISLASTNVGDAFVVADPDDPTVKYRLTVEIFTSSTVCKVRSNRLIPVALRGAITTWDFAILDVGGLSHLEGETVSILSDGFAHAERTVASGKISLQEPGVVVHVGLGYVSDFETLDVNVAGQETIRDKMKSIPVVNLILDETRGLMAGSDEDHLYEIKDREYENYDESTTPTTGVAQFEIDSDFNKKGRIFVRQSYPLPATILAAIPVVTVTG